MPAISIIIPVYNAEKYIRECLDSIICQTFSDFEVLLIDDGSPDKSGVICDEYATKDTRFKVFHKANGGVSSARNLGICKAQGEWLTFVDADDMLNSYCLEQCMYYSTNNSLDLLQFGYSTDKAIFSQCNNDNHSKVYNTTEFFSTRHNVTVWGNFIKTSVIDLNRIRFNENMKLAEDQLFTLNVIKHSNRIQAITDKLYYYRINPESATHTAKIVDIIQSSRILLDGKKLNPEFTHQIDNTIISFMVEAILHGGDQVKEMEYIYNSAHIKYHDRIHLAGKVFFYLSKVSSRMAIWFISKYFKLKMRGKK